MVTVVEFAVVWDVLSKDGVVIDEMDSSNWTNKSVPMWNAELRVSFAGAVPVVGVGKERSLAGVREIRGAVDCVGVDVSRASKGRGVLAPLPPAELFTDCGVSSTTLRRDGEGGGTWEIGDRGGDTSSVVDIKGEGGNGNMNAWISAESSMRGDGGRFIVSTSDGGIESAFIEDDGGC
jgi:hypothetical protein